MRYGIRGNAFSKPTMFFGTPLAMRKTATLSASRVTGNGVTDQLADGSTSSSERRFNVDRWGTVLNTEVAKFIQSPPLF